MMSKMTKEYLAISPFGLIPALQDGDFTLSESSAILKYICLSQDLDDSFYPKTDAKQQALFNARLDWGQQTIRKFSMAAIINVLHKPLIYKIVVPKEETEKSVADFVAKLDQLNSLLEGKKFVMGGEKLSIVDLQHYFEVSTFLSVFKDVDVSKMSNFSEWLERMHAFPEVQEVLELGKSSPMLKHLNELMEAKKA
jgi:glutathione S-transferase